MRYIALIVLVILSGCAKNNGMIASDLENLENTMARIPITTGSGVYASDWASAINTNLTEVFSRIGTVEGWGNHASAGYIKSYSETDPLFSAWGKSLADMVGDSTHRTVTDAQISAWDAGGAGSVTGTPYQVSFFGADGILTGDTGASYDPTTDTMTVGGLAVAGADTYRGLGFEENTADTNVPSLWMHYTNGSLRWKDASGINRTFIFADNSVIAGLQTQIDNINASQIVDVPTSRNTPCTKGSEAFSDDGLTGYKCSKDNFWTTYALTDSLSDTAGAPSLLTATILSSGLSASFVYDKAVTASTTANLCDDYSASFDTAGALTFGYTSGTGTTTINCSVSPTVLATESQSANLVYTPGDIVSVADATALTIPVPTTITNNSIYNPSTVQYQYDYESAIPAGITITGAATWQSTGTPTLDGTYWGYTNQNTSPAYFKSQSLGGISSASFYSKIGIKNVGNSLGLIHFLDASSNIVGRVYTWNTDGLNIEHGSVSTSTADNIWVNGTVKHLWLDWTQSTGSNGTIKLYLADTATKPASPTVEITTGTSTAAVDSITWGGTSGTGTGQHTWDNTTYGSDIIGSNP